MFFFQSQFFSVYILPRKNQKWLPVKKINGKPKSLWHGKYWSLVWQHVRLNGSVVAIPKIYSQKLKSSVNNCFKLTEHIHSFLIVLPYYLAFIHTPNKLVKSPPVNKPKFWYWFPLQCQMTFKTPVPIFHCSRFICFPMTQSRSRYWKFHGQIVYAGLRFALHICQKGPSL